MVRTKKQARFFGAFFFSRKGGFLFPLTCVTLVAILGNLDAPLVGGRVEGVLERVLCSAV